MPLTFPAHQAPLLPLKLWRPQAIDATALCVGAAAPDLAYGLGWWLGRQSHTAIGVALWAVPVTLLVCWVTRRRAAAGVFAHVPDGGPLRLRSLRVLGRRRPLPVVTLLSAVLGSVSHVVIDGFTHQDRWGARWLGIDGVIGELPLRGELTGARVLQYVGHVGGTLLGAALLVEIGRRRLLERWYGDGSVAAARQVIVTTMQRALFWSVALVPPAAVAAWRIAHDRNPVFAAMAAALVGLLVAGCLPLHRASAPSSSPAPAGGSTEAPSVEDPPSAVSEAGAPP